MNTSVKAEAIGMGVAEQDCGPADQKELYKVCYKPAQDGHGFKQGQ